MLKRLIGALLALMLCVASVGAYAGETADSTGLGEVTIMVVDMLGEPMAGMEVTVSDLADVPVQTFTTDETGTVKVEGLTAATYSAKALDPSDGYSAVDWFIVPEVTELTLTLRKLQQGSEITVGNVTKVNGSFFTDMWGNNTSDIDVRAMLHGYQTVSWTTDLQAALDTSVVTLDSVVETRRGDKTYTFTVNNNLMYNDGTPIDARDYVFSILLQSSPQALENGAMAYAYTHLAGFEDYNTGEETFFSGVRLINNRQFSMTIAGDYLPYYYELVYLNVIPYPISVIVPGCEVADEGEGALIRPLYDEFGNPLGEFTTEVLAQTILDPETGYLSHPGVTSGPYKLESYDPETGEVEFLVNLNFKGNYAGQKPYIEKVKLVVVDKADMMDKLEAEEINILNKITDVEAIDKGMLLRDEQKAQAITYLRSGQGFIGLACEQSPTSHERVRQAISRCVDEQEFATKYTGEYGLPVYSNYGLGQWMAAPYVNTMQDEVETYPMDLDEAKKLLEKDGWTLNEKGTRFVEGEDLVRYRKLNGRELTAYREQENPIVEIIQVERSYLMPLELHYADVVGSGMCDLVTELIIPRLEQIGFRVLTEEVEFTQMLRCYYRQDDRTYNFFALASNFTYVYDPYYEFNGAEEFQGELNRSGINDRDLLRYAQRLRETEPDEQETYIERWLQLMEYYSEILPAVPIYSNMYVDFATPLVRDYAPNNAWSWPVAILYTYIGEPEDEVLFTELEGEVSGPFSQPET